jgi:hypothetical protein
VRSRQALLTEASGALSGTTAIAHFALRHAGEPEECTNPGCAGNRKLVTEIRSALGFERAMRGSEVGLLLGNQERGTRA